MKSSYTQKRKTFVYFCTILLFSLNAISQVGIGTTDPNANALLDIDASTTPGGLLLPRVALVATNNISPLPGPLPIDLRGITVYNTATAGTGVNQVTPGFYYHDGSFWVRISASTDPKTSWELQGNSDVTVNDWLGTRNNQSLYIKTNNSDVFEITAGNSNTRGRLLANEPGSASMPTYSWVGRTNTGMWSQAANVVSFSTNGTERFRIPNANQVHAMNTGSASYPFYSWASNSRMGMFGAGPNILAFSTNANESMRILADRRIAVNRTTAINGNTRLTVGESGANRAIYGNSGGGEAIRGEVTGGTALIGLATTGTGVYGGATTTNTQGGLFINQENNGFGLKAGGGTNSLYAFNNSGTGAAVTGRTYGLTSVATATNGDGLIGLGDGLTGLPSHPLGSGVVGVGYQTGVFGDSGYYSQTGVYGRAAGDPFGTGRGIGVYGENTGGLGEGVYGKSSNVGVRGFGANGAILESNNNNGFGAVAWNTSASGANRIGLIAIGQNLNPLTFAGTGAILYGRESGGAGWAENGMGTGLIGVGNTITTASLAQNGSGVAGTGNSVGVYGKANSAANGIGVIGLGNNLGIYNIPGNLGAGVAGTGNNIGVFGHATDSAGYGVYSSGNLHVTGNVTAVGNLLVQGDLGAAGTKNFIIDDPRDPANKYLKHASIESNEILNLYRGVSTFDNSGEAVVQLPDYYEAINKNASYQLTPIGAAMPNIYIAEEVKNGSFMIAGGVPGKKVSWTITAERNDPYIRYNSEIRNMVVDKGADRGRYLSPEAYGQSSDKGILDKRVSEMQTSHGTATGKPGVDVQEILSKTAEAKKLNPGEVRNTMMSFQELRKENSGTRELRDRQIIKADEVKVPTKPQEQNGQESLDNVGNNTETPVQNSGIEFGSSQTLSEEPRE